MRLRNRLISIMAASVIFIAGLALFLVSSEHNNAIQQIDSQLSNLEPQATKVLKQGESSSNSKAPIFPSNFFLGTVSENGQILHLIGADSVGTPDLSNVNVVGLNNQFFTVPLEAPASDDMRILVMLKDKQTAVLGIPLDSVNHITQQLALNSALGTVVIAILLGIALMWVNKLSVQPIRLVTSVAQRINSGDTESRVPPIPANSDAYELGRAMNLLLENNLRSQQRLTHFVSDAAHELRTPLTVISGYSQLIGNGQLSPGAESTDAIERIRSESSRLSRLVNDLLTLATLDSEQVLQKRHVEVSQLARQVMQDVHIIEPRSQILMVTTGETWANVDSDLITQWFVIVLSNAMEFCPTEPILISVHNQDGWLNLSVKDSGPGVPHEFVPTMFDRFARAERLDSISTHRGFGLGLSIARAIVEAHSGNVGVNTNSEVSSETYTEIWAKIPLIR